MTSRTPEKSVPGIKTSANDIHFISGFWDLLFQILTKLSLPLYLLPPNCRPACGSCVETLPQWATSQTRAIPLVNQYTKCCCRRSDLSQSHTCSPHHKGLWDQTQKFNKKHTPFLHSSTSKMKQHWYWSAWCWQPHWATSTLASWEQALKIIIYIQYVGCWEDQIWNNTLGCNGFVLACLTSTGFISIAKNVTSCLIFPSRTHNQKLGDEWLYWFVSQEESLKEKNIFLCVVPNLVRYEESSFLKLSERIGGNKQYPDKREKKSISFLQSPQW